MSKKMKKCSMCGITKELSEFTKNKKSSNGTGAWCKSCKKQYDKERMAKPENQERRRIVWRAHYRKNGEIIRTAQKIYRKSKPNKRKADKLRQYWPELKPDERVAKYDQMVIQQEGLCKLCKKPEKSLNGNTKKIQILSVDHN